MRLSDFELSIFRYIHENPNCSAVSVLNHFGKKIQRHMVVQKLIEMHIQKGHITRTGVSPVANRLDLTAPGISLMLLNEDMRAQDAQKKRDKAFDRKINIATALISAVSFLVGLLVEHYSGIFEWLTKTIG